MKRYIVSFGDSRKYHVDLDDSAYVMESDVKRKILGWLKDKYPLLNADRYYDSMKVREVPADTDSSYPLLDATALADIKRSLSTEIADAASVRSLDNDAPYSDI